MEKKEKFKATPIVIDTNFYSVEMKENRSVRQHFKNNFDGFILFVNKETDIKLLVAEMCKNKSYPPVIQKLIDFRNEFSPTGETENTDDLKDFFKILKRVQMIFNKNFYTEVIIRMMRCAAIGPGCFAKTAFNAKFLAAFVDKDVRKKFWGTKSLMTILIVIRLLEDLNNGISMEKLTKKNLKKSGLVLYFLPKGKNLDDFMAYAKRK